MRMVCGDALNPVARPGWRRLRNYGLDGIRLVAFDKPEFYAYHSQLKMAGAGTAVVLTGSSFSGTDYRAEARRYAERINPSFWILGNEWNVQGDASWPVGMDNLRRFWSQAVSGILEAQPLAQLWVGGLMSEAMLLQKALLAANTLDPTPAGIDVHPYFTSNVELEAISTRLRALGLGLAVMEWNWANPLAIPGYAKFLDSICTHWAWIPWDSRQLLDIKAGLATGERKTKYGQALSNYLLSPSRLGW